MQTIIYISDQHTTSLTQLFDITNVECSQQLNGIDTASFRISANHQANKATILRPYHHCRITALQDDGTEKVYIDGLIDSIDASLSTTTVYVKSYEFLLEKMIVTANTTYSNQPINTILNTLRSSLQQRHDRWITLACTIPDQIDLSVSEWSSFSSVLQELVKLWYQYRIQDKVLTIASSVGIDQSSGIDCVLLKRDINDPQDRNINEATIRYDGGNLINAPYAKSTGFLTSAESIDFHWRVEQVVTSDGSDNQALQDTLSKYAYPQQIITVDPRISDFFFANIGDCIALVLDAWNELMYYQGAVYVLQKTIDTRWVVKVTVSTTTTKPLSFLETIRDNQKRLQKLENT